MARRLRHSLSPSLFLRFFPSVLLALPSFYLQRPAMSRFLSSSSSPGSRYNRLSSPPPGKDDSNAPHLSAVESNSPLLLSSPTRPLPLPSKHVLEESSSSDRAKKPQKKRLPRLHFRRFRRRRWFIPVLLLFVAGCLGAVITAAFQGYMKNVSIVVSSLYRRVSSLTIACIRRASSSDRSRSWRSTEMCVSFLVPLSFFHLSQNLHPCGGSLARHHRREGNQHRSHGSQDHNYRELFSLPDLFPRLLCSHSHLASSS